MARSEAKWQVIFNQYLREKRLHGYYELKQTSAETFPFSKIETNQYEGLQATKKEGLVWKLSDEDRRLKPCDTLCIPPLSPISLLNLRTDSISSISTTSSRCEKREKRELLVLEQMQSLKGYFG